VIFVLRAATFRQVDDFPVAIRADVPVILVRAQSELGGDRLVLVGYAVRVRTGQDATHHFWRLGVEFLHHLAADDDVDCRLGRYQRHQVGLLGGQFDILDFQDILGAAFLDQSKYTLISSCFLSITPSFALNIEKAQYI